MSDINNLLEDLNKNIKDLSEDISGFMGGEKKTSLKSFVRDTSKSNEEIVLTYDKERQKIIEDILEKQKESTFESKEYNRLEQERLELEEKAKNTIAERNELLVEEAAIAEQISNIQKEIESSEDNKEENQEKLNELIEEQKRLTEAIGDKTEQLNKELRKSNELYQRQAQMPNKMGRYFNDFNKVVNKIKEGWQLYKSFTEPWVEADAAASKFAKTVGMTGEEMGKLRDGAISNVANKIARDFNMSTAELLAVQENYLKGAGRNIRMSDEDQADMAAISSVAGDKGIEMASAYDNLGISMAGTAKAVGKMFNEATKEGVLFDKYAENVTKNIKMAQTYKFKDGVRGLEQMAKKATALKLDMQMVANFAEKVSNIEGAMNTAAKLQVLGGPFATMADPLALLNEGLTDMNGLQDRVVKMIQGMGYFDKTTGQVTVSAFNMQRIKAMADATGMDYAGLMDSVHAQGRRNEIGNQIKANSKLAGLDDSTKELLMNSGTFNNEGKAGVTIDGKFKALEDLDLREGSSDRAALEAIQRTDSDNIREIALDVRSLREKREGLSKTKDAFQAKIASFFTKRESAIIDWLGKIGKWLLGILGGVLAIQAIQSIGGFLGIGKAAGGMAGGTGGGLFAKIFGNAGGAATAASGAASTGAKQGIFQKIGGFFSRTSAGAGNAITTGTSKMASVGKFFGNAGKGIMSGGLAGAAGGIGLGLVGALGNHLTDKAVESGKMKVGGVGHTVAKAGSQAAKYAGIGLTVGSLAGPLAPVLAPVGAALGAVAGAVVGSVQAAKAKNKKVVDEQLAKKGIELKGDYGNGKLKKIDKALQTGEISDRMRRRLIADGNMAVVEEIERVKKEKEAEKAEKEEEEETTKKGKFAISKASITIKNASISGLSDIIRGKDDDKGLGKLFKFGLGFDRLTGESGDKTKPKMGLFSGLSSLFNKDNDKSPTLLSKLNNIGLMPLAPFAAFSKFFKGGDGDSSTFMGNLLMSNLITAPLALLSKKINITGKQETGKTVNWAAISPKNNDGGNNSTTGNDQAVTNRTFDLNINGTLKLTTDNGQSFDIMTELRRNPTLLRSLSDMIAKEINGMVGGVNRVHKPGIKS
jgi:hypothetical protein